MKFDCQTLFILRKKRPKKALVLLGLPGFKIRKIYFFPKKVFEKKNLLVGKKKVSYKIGQS